MATNVEIVRALETLTPTAEWNLIGSDYANIQWFSSEITKPTEDEINAEIARQTAYQPLAACKQKAQQLLDESDWSTKSDVTDTSLHPHLVNAADFVAYRLTLRTLRINPEADPIWPTPPTEIWSS
jgi:hypothetical protein